MPSDAIENATSPITEITSHADLSNVSAMYAATLPTDLAGNLPEGTVFQIMPDAAIWTVTDSDSVPKGVLTSETFILNDGKTAIQQISSPVSNVRTTEVSSLQSCSVQSSAEQITVHSERNITDLDLSFLNDSDHELNAVSANSSNQTSKELMNDPLSVSVNDSQVSSPGPHVDSNFSLTDQGVITDTETLVMVDVSKPIQLSQNSLIVVNGKKCVLQQDSQTGQVIAYPVAEPDKPKKKRGRPKKIIHEVEDHSVNSEPYVKITQYFEDISDDETISKKGLLEVINDDGACVRRSSRKRKRTKLLKDYETGNLNQEIGSDVDDTPLSMKDDCVLTRKKSRQRTVGRTKKGSSLSSDTANNRRILKGKVEQSKISMVEPEQAQSFLIQTADGQQLMIQVPFSSIPPGMSVHDVAQDIADTINFGASHIQNNSTSNSSESLAAAPDSTVLSNETVDDSEVANNSSVIASLPLDVNASRLCNEENIYPSTDVEPKNLNLSLENTKINTDMQFTSTISSEMNSCTTIEITNPSQSNMSEFEYALAYSAPLPDFGSSTAVSKASFPGAAKETEVILSIPEVEVKEYEGSSHSTNDKFVHSYLELTENSSTSQKSIDKTLSDTDHLNDIGVSEEVVYSSPGNEEVQELERKNMNEDTVHELYQNNICTSSENADMLFLQCDDQIIPLSDIKNANNIDTDSTYVHKNSEIDANIHITVAGGELYLQKSNMSPSLFPIISEDSTICEQSACNYFVDSCVQSTSSNPVTYATQGSVENSCNIEKIETKLLNNEITTTNHEPKTYQTSSQSKLVDEGQDSSKKCLSLTEVQSLYQTHFCEINGIDSSQSEVILPLVGDEHTSENCVLSASPLKTKCKSKKNLSLLLPKISDNSVFALETYQCTKCEFNTVYDNEYQHHLNLHSENIEECKNCKFTYSKEEELFEHFRKSHPRWICTECNYIAEHPSDIKQHINEHSDTGCLCVVCGKTYKDQYILKMHVKLVHLPAEILFKCHLCDKQFNRKAHLKRHLRTHGPEKPFKCSYCEYRGCEKSDLTKHMLIHEEPKHECEFCGKTFRHIKNKELHIKRHKNQKDYKCGICEFFGYTFTDVRKHIEKVHTSSKVNSCNKCEQVFNSYKLMQKHQNNGQCEALAFKRKEQLDSSLLQAVCKSKKKKVVEEEDTLNFAEESDFTLCSKNASENS